MRQIFYSPGKLGLKLVFMLTLVVSMVWMGTQPSSAQSCEVDPLDVRIPKNQLSTGLYPSIDTTTDVGQNDVLPFVNKIRDDNLLSCEKVDQKVEYMPALEYEEIFATSLYQYVANKKYITAVVSCVHREALSSTQNPQLASPHYDYARPYIQFFGQKFFFEETGEVLGSTSSVENVHVEYSNHSLANTWTSLVPTLTPTMPADSDTAIYSQKTNFTEYTYLAPKQAIAITYSEVEFRQEVNEGYGIASDEHALGVFLLDALVLEMQIGLSSVAGLAGSVVAAGIDGVYTPQEGALLVAQEKSFQQALGITGADATSYGIALNIIDAATSLGDSFSNYLQISHQMASQPYEYSSLYSADEYVLLPDAAVEDKLRLLGYQEAVALKLALHWSPMERIIEIAGSGFFDYSNMDYQLISPTGVVLSSGQIRSRNNPYNSSVTTSYEVNQYLDYGELYHQLRIPQNIALEDGCYFLASSVKNEDISLEITAGNFIYIPGEPEYGPFLPEDYFSTNGTFIPNNPHIRTCSNPVGVLTEYAHTFNGANCGGDISWFSAHGNNGPSASGQVSLLVPNDAVVEVSSGDNGSGDTACFEGSIIDLSAVGWENRIQWAQVVYGGTCAPPSAPVEDYITLDTSGGDVVIHVGEDWDNQHNWLIEKFWQDGEANITLTHQNGSQRCWDYDIYNLSSHGDWNVQTSSASVEAGTCPGHDVTLCESDDGSGDDCNVFEVGIHNLLDTGVNDAHGSLKSVASGKSVMAFREGDYRGTAECYNGPRTPLPSGGAWDLKSHITTLQVFNSANCPASEIQAVVIYHDNDQNGAAVGLGTGTGIINLTDIPGNISFNDWGASIRIPVGKSVIAYEHSSKGGAKSNCLTGDANIAGSLYRQVSSVQIFGNGNCAERADVFAIQRHSTSSAKTEVSILDGSNNFQSWLMGNGTLLGETADSTQWTFGAGDKNGDGIDDLYAIKRHGTDSGMTEVNVLDGATNFQTWIAGTATILGQTPNPTAWNFAVGDYNGDGIDDVYAIQRHTTSAGKTQVSVLDGATNFQTWLAGANTLLGETPDATQWNLAAGDYNADGKDDLYIIKRHTTNSGKTEINVLDAATNFQSWLMGTGSLLDPTPDATMWNFAVGDYNGDNKDDVYAIKRHTAGTSTTEIHVLNAGNNFQSWLVETGTVLGQTSDAGLWNFIVGDFD